MTLLIGLDIGTTTIKAAAYDPALGQVIALAIRPTPTTQPVPGRSEHDPELLWQAVAACLREVMSQNPHQPVAGIAIASLAEAGLPLDAAGRSLYPIIAWYDRRCEAQAAWWESQIDATALHAITGQRVSPSFGINKWLWIRDNVDGAAEHLAHWLSVPDYILWRLCSEMATDYSIASRTLLFDQKRLAWSDELLARAGLTTSQLPRTYASGTRIGAITPAAARATGLPTGAPCMLGGHDHLCAALAAGACQPGNVVDSSGTAQAVIAVVPAFHTGPRLAQAGYACYAHVVPGQYIVKAGLKAAGGAIAWLTKQLASSDETGGDLPYAKLAATAAAGVGCRAGPLWLPHLIGSGTPEGDRFSRAALVGLRSEHDRGDIFRGLLESLAFWLRRNLEDLREITGYAPSSLILLGGTLRLPLLAQLKADVTHLPVVIPDLPEAAATGAALLAGLGSGCFRTPAEAVASLRTTQTTLAPDPAHAAWYDGLYRQAYRPLYRALRDVHHALEALEPSKIPM